MVEDRFFERYPEEAAILLKAYGQRWRAPDRPSGHYPLSAFLANRLSESADEGHLVKTFGPAEGPWAYNSVISWWRVAGSDDTGDG